MFQFSENQFTPHPLYRDSLTLIMKKKITSICKIKIQLVENSNLKFQLTKLLTLPKNDSPTFPNNQRLCWHVANTHRSQVSKVSKFQSFQILEYNFLSEHFQKSISNGVFNFIVSCRMQYYNFLKRKLYYMYFCEYFPKSSVQKFQNILMRAFAMKF